MANDNVFNINPAGDDQLHGAGDDQLLHRAALDLYDDIVTEFTDYDEHTWAINDIDYDGYAAACIKYLRRFAHDRPDWYLGATGRHPSHGVGSL